MDAVDVISSFCHATGLLKFRIAININITKVLLPVLPPFYYSHKYRTLPDTYIVKVRKAQALQMGSLKSAFFWFFSWIFPSSHFFECVCFFFFNLFPYLTHLHACVSFTFVWCFLFMAHSPFCLFPFWSLAHEYAYARCSCNLKKFKIKRHSLPWCLHFNSWQWSTHSAVWSSSFCKNREAGQKKPHTQPNNNNKRLLLRGVFWSFLKYLTFSYWKSCTPFLLYFLSLHHLSRSSSFCPLFFTLHILFSSSCSSF